MNPERCAEWAKAWIVEWYWFENKPGGNGAMKENLA
jgi:hypothetical protein